MLVSPRWLTGSQDRPGSQARKKVASQARQDRPGLAPRKLGGLGPRRLGTWQPHGSPNRRPVLPFFIDWFMSPHATLTGTGLFDCSNEACNIAKPQVQYSLGLPITGNHGIGCTNSALAAKPSMPLLGPNTILTQKVCPRALATLSPR